MGSQLYKSFIMDHVKNPRNEGLIENHTHISEAANASCGDEIALRLRVDSVGIIKEVGYKVRGCAISTASMSILSERLIGMKLEEAREIDDKEMFDMMGIDSNTGRSKCVLLSRDALRKAVEV